MSSLDQATEPASSAAIAVTIFSHARDNHGTPQELTWPEFCEAMIAVLTEERRAEKDQLPAVGPYALTLGKTRSGANVDHVSLAALDIDRGLADVDTLLASLRDLGLTAFVHASPSDPAPDSRKVRVYVLPSRPIAPDECKRVRRALAALLEVPFDTSTIDPSRIFFAGIIQGTPEREYWTIEGEPLDVDALLATWADSDDEQSGVHERDAGPTALSAKTLEQIGRVAEIVAPFYCVGGSGSGSGNSHAFSVALAGWYKSKNQSRAAAEHLLCEALPTSNAAQKRKNVADAWAMATPPAWEAMADLMRAVDPERAGEALAALDAIKIGWRPAQAEPFHPVGRGAPASCPPHVGSEKRSDLGNARRLVRMHGVDLRYCVGRGLWYVWDGARWCADDTGEIQRRAKQSAEALWDEAKEESDDDKRKEAFKWAASSQNAAKIASAITLAETEPGVAVRVTELDADPWLLNVQNGTLNLKTGEMCEPDRALLMTKCCAAEYRADARSDLWDRFIERTTGDSDLAAYIQRALGYALFGAWREKAFWFGYGPPDGAKSTLLGVVGRVLGDYHVSVDPSTWMVQNSVGGNRGDVVRLLGARLATSLEIRPGLRFDEALVKKVTGGDMIVAAAKYEGEIQFPPTVALWMGANDRPIIREDDEGMWSRVRCVTFTHPVPAAEQDKSLAEKLTSGEHAPAVLGWLVRGCLAWQRDGVGSCTAVDLATNAYRAGMNRAAGFLEECCEVTGRNEDEVPCSHMRRAYESWCKASNVRNTLTPKALGQRLRALGVGGGNDESRHKVNGEQQVNGEQPGRFGFDRHWTGVKLVG